MEFDSTIVFDRPVESGAFRRSSSYRPARPDRRGDAMSARLLPSCPYVRLPPYRRPWTPQQRSDRQERASYVLPVRLKASTSLSRRTKRRREKIQDCRGCWPYLGPRSMAEGCLRFSDSTDRLLGFLTANLMSLISGEFVTEVEID